MLYRGLVVSCMSFVCVIMFECIHLILRFNNFESRSGVTKVISCEFCWL